MQKAPVLKGSGLKPLDKEDKSGDNVHVFGSNLDARVVTPENASETQISFAPDKEEDIETIKKRKFDAITGEEEEETVFQGDFKLFVWDLITSNWTEKGRGQLKLNENQEKKSRIIMRVAGTHKIILNVAIRPPTFKVLANSKNSIRFTDSQTVWAASGNNATHLRHLIDERLETNDEAEEAKKKLKTKEDEEEEGESEGGGEEEEEEDKEEEEDEDKEKREKEKVVKEVVKEDAGGRCESEKGKSVLDQDEADEDGKPVLEEEEKVGEKSNSESSYENDNASKQLAD